MDVPSELLHFTFLPSSPPTYALIHLTAPPTLAVLRAYSTCWYRPLQYTPLPLFVFLPASPIVGYLLHVYTFQPFFTRWCLLTHLLNLTVTPDEPESSIPVTSLINS